MLALRLIVFVFALCLGISVGDEKPKLRKGDKNGLLDVCQGDCNSRKDCKPGLYCFKRPRGDTTEVPGCSGMGKPGRDYCYKKDEDKKDEEDDPTDNTLKPKEPTGNTLKPKEAPNTKPAPPETLARIEHVGTTRIRYKGPHIYKAKIKVPEGTVAGDLLVLVLHRTDGFLPMSINGDFGNSGWTRAAECLKSGNGKDCGTFKECKKCLTRDELKVRTKNTFCHHFDEDGQFGPHTKGWGRDLAQAIFYKEAGPKELTGPRSVVINFNPDKERENAAWMFLSAIRGADTKDPIRDWTGRGLDDVKPTVFPPVYGKKGDLLLLSQGFDQGAPGVKIDSFLAPKGFVELSSMFDCLNPLSRLYKSVKCDEAGYLFGKVLDRDGRTGEQKTLGTGAGSRGDGMLSLTIMPKGGTKDNRGRGASEWLGTKGNNCPPTRRRPDDS